MRPSRGWALAAVLLGTGTVAQGDGGSAPAAAIVRRSDAGAVAVEVRFPPPVVLPGDARDGSSGSDLTVPGLPRTRTPGQAALPFRPVLVALPPGAAYDLEVVLDRSTPFPHRQPAPFAEPVDADGVPLAVATDPPRDKVAAPVEIAFDGWLRHRRVVRLVFHPLTGDDDGGSVFHGVITARLRLRTPGDDDRFDSVFRLPASGAPTRTTGRDGAPVVVDPFAPLYRRAILNEPWIDPAAYGRAVQRLRPGDDAARQSAAAGPAGQAMSMSGVAARIPVRDEGLWSVSHADLLAAGVDGSGTPVGDIRLFAGGVELPRRVVDGGDGLFGAGDRVEFHGVGLDSDPQIDTNIYRLAFGEGAGIALPTRDATPAGGSPAPSFIHTRHVELNGTLFTTAADDDGDLNAWVRVLGSIPRDFPDPVTEPADLLVLPGLDPAATTVTVRARAFHLNDSPHTSAIRLNGVDLMDQRTWSTNSVTHEATTSTANLLPQNTVRLELSGSTSDQILFNWLEIDYPRLWQAVDDVVLGGLDVPAPVAQQITGFTGADIEVWDVTDPSLPVRLTGVSVSGPAGDHTVSFTDTVGGPRRFIARAGSAAPPGTILADTPSDLMSAANGADLIIVAYRDFLDEMAPLVAARQAEGLRVALVDRDDVYDEFSYGRADPEALRDFLAHAYATWTPPAPAYVLLVGNSTLDPLQELSGSVPPLMPTATFQAPTLGIAATDNYFVTVAGGDPLPEMTIGRFPAEDEQQAADMVAKTLSYAATDPALFNHRVLAVADNDDPLFEGIQEDFDTLYLFYTRVDLERAYLRLLGTSATRQKIIDTINEGVLWTNYLGHGNIHNWAAENAFVDTVDLPSLTNDDRLTFMTTLNCINGFHAAPRAPNVASMAEQALAKPDGGAVAVWSPTALGALNDYAVLSDELFQAVFEDRVSPLGLATTLAKVDGYTLRGISSANLDEMTFFGDPTLVLRVDGDTDGLVDADEDGCACGLDARDADSDDDGLLDGAEPTPQADSDGDGLIDALDPDSDDDGLPDGLEAGIDVADIDTAVALGHFRPDLDTGTTTDPRNADTDAGGAPDGAEDRDVDGAVGAGETDPEIGADDPACGALPPPELAGLMVDRSGDDVVLTWTEIQGQDPCTLYRVLEADFGATSPVSLPPLAGNAVTSGAAWTDAGAALETGGRYYLVVATRPGYGDGPTGH